MSHSPAPPLPASHASASHASGSHSSADRHRVASLGGILVTLGIIFGDIGTSPLYVLRATIGERVITDELVLGAVSLIFWTITLQTTVKYVLLTLQADNRGEGGILALYALVRRLGRWLIVPAIFGASALLADGMIAPPISVSSAVEGLRKFDPTIPTVPIVICIIAALFSFQQFGTSTVGKAFGPVMLIWFSMLAVLGLGQLVHEPILFTAINPVIGIKMLFDIPGAFWLLGAIFLCTTGAEGLYSDLGHCGRKNIQYSWVFVKIALLLNYFGQGAWLLAHRGQTLEAKNPFFEVMPVWFLPAGVGIATAATVIASQASISGAFTIITEAMRLSLFPKSKVVYPTELKGQIYVPFMNRLLFVGCIVIVLYFRESANMEAAYGFLITLTMLMTTFLLSFYLRLRKVARPLIVLLLVVFLTIEGAFFVANLAKFAHGGWVTLLMGAVLSTTMWIWNRASRLKREFTDYVNFHDHLPTLEALSLDESISKFSTHLVYLTGAPVPSFVEMKVIYSIFRKRPKRADVYWFLHVNVLDTPYTTEYEVTTLIPGKAFRVDFNLGFRVEPRVNLFFRRAVEELARNGEVDLLSRYQSLRQNNIPGDFQFVVLQKELSYENSLPFYERVVMTGYFFLKRFSLSEEKSFGLDTSSVVKERVPLVISPHRQFELTRIVDEPPRAA